LRTEGLAKAGANAKWEAAGAAMVTLLEDLVDQTGQCLT